MPIPSFLRVLAATLGAVLTGSCGEKPADTEWSVDGRILGASKKNGDIKESRDISGIACDTTRGFPRRCVIIDDEVQFAQAVTLEDGRLVAGAVLPLISNTFAGKRLELDGEAVAFADGAFYVAGSHGHPRDQKGRLDPQRDADEISTKITASSQVLRVRAPAEAWQDGVRSAEAAVVSSARLREALQAVPALRPFIDRRLDDNGLTLEGMAIANGRLYAGLRGPLLEGGQAAVVDVSLTAMFGTGALEPRLSRLDLAGRGIRDQAFYDGAFLVLAGPSGNDGDSYGIYRWDGSGEAVLKLELPDYDGNKPEAILPIDVGSDGLRVLVMLDGAQQGAPRVVTIKP